MSTSFEAKDSAVRSAQLKVQSVMVKCDLEAGTSQEPAVVSISGEATATCSIVFDIKEEIDGVVKAVVTDNSDGSVVAQSAAAVVSGTTITVGDVDASTPDLSDVTVEVHYKVK